MSRAFAELLDGYAQDPSKILARQFEGGCDLVVTQGIEFTSLCKHHLLPFSGRAYVGYLPRGRVVGLSKVARLVQCFAHRLQLQENMTHDISSALYRYVDAQGVGCIITATHTCMNCRGVQQRGASVTTMDLRGDLRRSPANFLAVVRCNSQKDFFE